ncbi:MAG: hypothetical protein IJ317_05390 [Clostridia bacterium]|nr:hypothetical protein [Clostridia bacterium]
MQRNGEKDEVLQTLISVEDLAEKKTKIYSRLLTDATLAKDMEELALRHSKRKQALQRLLNGKTNAKGEEE